MSLKPRKMRIIILTQAERQSGYTRQKAAESLICQLPENHEARNTWLMNYGISVEANKLRDKHHMVWDDKCLAAKPRKGAEGWSLKMKKY